jgi:hypothetical protein
MDWLNALRRTRDDIESLVPRGAAFIFVDDDQWGREAVADDRRPLPFIEKDGAYWGPPADDAVAIAELERLRDEGAELLLFAWPAFWWLEYYSKFAEHLSANYRKIWQGRRLIAFDLRPPIQKRL